MLDAIDWEILIWLIVAGLSGAGELLTGTFLLVPLVVGAIAAAVAVALGAEILLVLLVFGVVALSALGLVLRFAGRTKDDPPATREGARRYVDARGLVTTEIDPLGRGRVSIGGQSWRALSNGGGLISAGSKVRVLEVRGTALIVEEI
jgi:membrane protein implicated in regulation of membrane protease activity